jgi:DNA-binding CsgD family transcriptional regulator
MLIPYTKGYFIVFNEAGGIESEKSSFIEMEPGVYEEYLDSYYEKDYMKYTFELSEHTITYRDTDIMEESLRQKTEFYQGFLKPNHIPFGAGILLRRYGKPIGIVNFFRSELLGDFSDKDMFILEVLKGHLSHKLAGLLNGTKQAAGDRNKMLAHLAAEFELSEREKEALTCMDGGMTNAQIAENMGISLSTVKKHVYHIFEKVGVDTRAQLRNVLETYNSTKF